MGGIDLAKRSKCWSRTILSVAVLLLGGLSGAQVQAGACYGPSGSASCQYEVSSTSIAPGSATSMGIRFDAHTTNVLFNNFGNLAPRFIDNNGGNPLFVPQGTYNEFLSFLNRGDPNVVVDYAIAPSSYTATPRSYASCGAFSPSSYTLPVPLTSTVSGWLRMGSGYASHPHDVKTIIGSTNVGSQLSYTYSRTDTLRDYEGNNHTASVLFIQTQQATISAQGSASNAPYFTWNISSPSVSSELYYGLNGSTSYTPVADCSANYAPPIYGTCGAANNKNVSTAPTSLSDLCTAGNTSPPSVSGSGPWAWYCGNVGTGGGTWCQTGALPVDGICGSDNGKTLANAPTNLCSSGTASGVSTSSDGSSYSWSCEGANTGSNASCSATHLVESCIPTGQPVPPGQTQCPTKSCFFWVSGLPLGPANAGLVTKIGDNSVTWEAAAGPAGSNGVGAGSYADSYGSPSNPGPFFYAANGSFDGIAIGEFTRVTVYQGKNFSGPVIFDQHGPLVVNDLAMDMSDWSGYGTLFQQFPPSTRHLSDQFGLSNAPNQESFGYGPWNLWVLSGLPAPTFGFGFGPTSIKVTCDSQ